MNNHRIVYMGTPAFSAYILEKLIEAKYNIVGVVSQPDREVGRKRILTATPVKEVALKHNIPVFQPEKIRNDFSFMEELNADLVVTCAYGQIVPEAFLNILPKGCINIHASLLPKYRGGAPIQWSIIKGEKQTGITLMEMVKRMDAGVMYAKEIVDILDSDNYDTLSEKLKLAGAKIILDNLDLYLEDKLIGVPQNEDEVIIAPNISKEDEHLSFNDTARNIFNKIRGLSSIPGTYAFLDNDKVKFYASSYEEKKTSHECGEIISFSKTSIDVACQDGVIHITEIQVPGKQRTLVTDFLNGNKTIKIGQIFK